MFGGTLLRKELADPVTHSAGVPCGTMAVRVLLFFTRRQTPWATISTVRPASTSVIPSWVCARAPSAIRRGRRRPATLSPRKIRFSIPSSLVRYFAPIIPGQSRFENETDHIFASRAWPAQPGSGEGAGSADGAGRGG